MPKPRKQQVSLDATPYYHCTSRCVRRAYLCGFDKLTGQSYEHRKQWVEDRILFLAEYFCIDVCAYAVMSNHHHLVLHINADENKKLTQMEVCQRWHKLYKGTQLTKKYLHGDDLNNIEWQAVQEKLKVWRLELQNISRFMWALNESIARKANTEDKCSGRFWESRFKSQALLDEKALLACMAYVDLNPVRANIATTPETSDHTSIKRRVISLKEKKEHTQLAHFIGNQPKSITQGLPFQLNEYIELIDITGRIIREDKPGYISQKLPPILTRLNINTNQWLILTTQFESKFKTLVGCARSLKRAIETFGLKRRPAYANCKAILH